VNHWESRTGTQRIRAIGQPFARRKVFCGNRLYKNKYELNEWLQEARRKGMSNPRDIWRYAQQKERLFMSMTCLASPPRFASREIGSPKAVVNHFNIVTDKG
jgi:hypothetical protein